MHQLVNYAVGPVNYHARLEVANLTEEHAMHGTRGVVVGATSVALRAYFHWFALRFLEDFAAKPL